MSALDSLRQLVLDDRRFRKEAIDRAQGVFAEIRLNLAGVLEVLGAGEDAYPIKIDQQNPNHLVALLGPRAVHIVLQPSVGVRKELVYSEGETMRPLFQEIAVAPDHAHPAEHSVAIEFVATLIAQSLSWGISVWPGPRKIGYEEILESRLLGLPASQVRVKERRIGFEPPRVGDEVAGAGRGKDSPK
jgi:hypothetical protein